MLGYWIVVSTQTPEERDAIIDRKNGGTSYGDHLFEYMRRA